jgi:hypothetical protein
MTGFVVQRPDGHVLAVFTDRLAADAYAAARPGRTVTTAPLVAEPLTMTTVHTRWVEVDARGEVRTDEQDSYQWCPELDTDDDSPPVAEIEQYSDGPRRRLLAVGTDAGLLAERLAEALDVARTALSQTRTS